jgi:hypothetical protein
MAGPTLAARDAVQRTSVLRAGAAPQVELLLMEGERDPIAVVAGGDPR